MLTSAKYICAASFIAVASRSDPLFTLLQMLLAKKSQSLFMDWKKNGLGWHSVSCLGLYAPPSLSLCRIIHFKLASLKASTAKFNGRVTRFSKPKAGHRAWCDGAFTRCQREKVAEQSGDGDRGEKDDTFLSIKSQQFIKWSKVNKKSYKALHQDGLMKLFISLRCSKIYLKMEISLQFGKSSFSTFYKQLAGNKN